MLRSAAGLVAAVCVAGLTSPPAARPVWVEPLTGMPFVSIPPGVFVMGSPPGERGRESQERQHEVAITRPFWMGKFEVTQEQWSAVMHTEPSWFRSRGSNLPVENVTWFEIEAFLNRLNEGSSDGRFRLPTEAEWEYACRAGSSTAYPWGSVLTRGQANVTLDPNTPAALRGGPVAVGRYPANAWGLHDMQGNVWEWTADEHCPYAAERVSDPKARCGSGSKVIRGGSWYFAADSARCALRYTHRPNDRGFSLGFRVVREVKATQPAA